METTLSVGLKDPTINSPNLGLYCWSENNCKKILGSILEVTSRGRATSEILV